MKQRHFLMGIAVAVLGLALACAPMTVASASHHKKAHHSHHHSTKTVSKTKTKTKSKTGSNPTSSVCAAINSTQKSSSNLGVALEKVIEGIASSGTFATAKQQMVAAINTAEAAEGPAEADLSSAPANVQAALKGLYGFFSDLKTTITNAASPEQLVTALESLGTNPQLKTDSVTLANYVSSLCGTTTTTT